MSADRQSIIVRAPYAISLSVTLSDADQQKANHLLGLLLAEDTAANSDIDTRHLPLDIKRFVDGRGLACPMPLLKTKVALRDVAIGESLYVVATDANSQADITAFCRQNQQTNTANPLILVVNSVTQQQPVNSSSAQRFDTIYHFIITKTDSN